MALPKNKEGLFTYQDYLTWPVEERWELINGVAYNMSSAPGRQHQQIVGNLFRCIADITDSGPCETYIAPFDVRLSAESENIDTVVQPDISVFCDLNKLDDKGAYGPPDLVAEVLSPATTHKDLTEKLALYEQYEVQEYWVVNGDAPWVMVYRLGPERKYSKPDYYYLTESVKSHVLGGVEIPVMQFLK